RVFVEMEEFEELAQLELLGAHAEVELERRGTVELQARDGDGEAIPVLGQDGFREGDREGFEVHLGFFEVPELVAIELESFDGDRAVEEWVVHRSLHAHVDARPAGDLEVRDGPDVSELDDRILGETDV